VEVRFYVAERNYTEWCLKKYLSLISRDLLLQLP